MAALERVLAPVLGTSVDVAPSDSLRPAVRRSLATVDHDLPVLRAGVLSVLFRKQGARGLLGWFVIP